MSRANGIHVLGAVVLASIAIGMGATASAAGLDDYRPQWKIGDEWYVESIKMPELPSLPPEELKKRQLVETSSIYRFIVVGIVERQGQPCFQIAVDLMLVQGQPVDTLPNPKVNRPRKHDNLYFRTSDCALVHVDSFERKLNVPQFSEDFNEWPCFVSAQSAYLPLDWPLFSEMNHASGETRQEATPSPADPAGKEVIQTVLTKYTMNGKQRDVVTVEEWAKGKPWWTKASQSINVGVTDQPELKCKCRLMTWPEVCRAIAKNETENGQQ